MEGDPDEDSQLLPARRARRGFLNSRTALLCMLALPFWAIGAELSGTLIVENQGKAVVGVEDIVVYFRPDEPGSALPPDEPAVMATSAKEFTPRILPIVVGTTVHFPNSDPILHNVFSSSKGNQFDLGLFGEGDGGFHTFTNAGLVRVFCNVHQSMVGHVLVLDTPYFGYADHRGNFSLTGLPEVPGTLYAWHDRARAPAQLRVTPDATSLSLNLNLTARKVPNHKNKHGKSYRRDRRRRY